MMISFDGLRVASRTLRKQPGFSTVVILSLALAIALNTTMYSVLDALIHPRVDIRDPDQLFKIRLYGDYHFRVSGVQRDSLLRSGTRSIEAIAWYDAVSQYGSKTVSAGQQYAEAGVGTVSPEYFDLMGPRLLAGRTFMASDENAETRPVVIGERLASQLFPTGGNPLGATIDVNDEPYVVIGVLSRYAEFPEAHAAAWTLGKSRTEEMYSRIVRVRPGASREALARDLDLVAERIATAAGEGPKDVAFRVSGPTRDQLNVRSFHIALIAAVIAVLLVACANVANMQLARGIGRRRELALRIALGATRRRIVTHLLTESALLSAAGLVLGLILTFWAAAALRASIPPSVGEYIVEPRMSWRVMVFALMATVACILLVGVAPAIRVSRVDPNEMLKAGNGTGATRRNRRQYGYLVAVEIALALGLLSGAAVMIRSSMRVSAMWYGFDPAPLASGYVTQRIPIGERRATSELLASMIQRVRSLPGVVEASADMGGAYERASVTLADSSGMRELPIPGYGYRIVTPSYFRAMGRPIIAGRDFMEGERDQPAVIIDEYTAKRLWPNANPIGALVKLGDARSAAPFVRIVGVVGQRDQTGKPAPMNMAEASGATIGYVYYLPGQGDSLTGGKPQYVASIVARTTGDPARLAPAMRRVGVMRAESMQDAIGIRGARESRAFVAKLFTLFAALGLGLAAFGVYGVVAHSVAERRREIGVRIALGASARDILSAVLRETVVIALAGTALGLMATKYGVMLLRVFAFSDDLYNAPMFAAVALFLAGAAAASAFAPALRATRVDPTESLRSE